MTVAAVILAASTESALADASGVARVRRIADAAWSGGAMPIVVLAPDRDGAVAAALAGAPVTLADPAAIAGGPVMQIALGMDIAVGEVTETTAALIWPAELCWVGPETITSLVEAHGADRRSVLRPIWRGDVGWPALLPIEMLAALRTLPAPSAPPELLDMLDLLVDGRTIASRGIDLGDPGTVIDGTTARDLLPPYEGPAEPADAHAHEWGEVIAATVDEAAVPGPAITRTEPR